MLLGLLILFTSFNSPTYLDMLKSFHVRAAGVKSVLKFERKFPQIIKDEKIYAAFLKVTGLIEKPVTLFYPSILWRILTAKDQRF